MKLFRYTNKTKNLLLFFALLIGSPAFTQQSAREFAAAFFNSRSGNALLKSAVVPSDLQQAYQSQRGTRNTLSVFLQEGKGYAIVAQSDETFSLVGYSDEPVLPEENLPPQLLALIQFYEDSLQVSGPLLKSGLTETTAIAPLLDKYGIKLNQYNHPEVGGSYTGCMATAVAQIMLYHAAEQGTPVKGYGEHCYMHSLYGEICADFEHASYANNPELLSLHAAIAMDMRFTTGGSSPPALEKIESIETYFGYYVKNAIREDFYLLNELEHQRPVYAGLTGFPENHAVVIDGMDNRGYYHLNFGWGGTFNGYFLMNSNTWLGTGSGDQKFFTNFSNIYVLSPSPLPVVEQDSLALVEVHHALGGYEATGWNLTRPVWDWPGVLVMNDRVIRLSITADVPPATSQSIAPQIGNLTALEELSINGCLNGIIPGTITDLTRLKELNLNNKAIYIEPTLHKGNMHSPLPADIYKLKDLEWLSVSNALEGPIPSSIGQLTGLKLLHLTRDTTYFGKRSPGGSIPSSIGNLSHLQSLFITNHQLTGTIPATMGNLTALRDLNLSGNQLEGAVPVISWPNLEYLKLNDNRFSTMEEGNGYANQLVDVQLQDNQIAGDVPSHIGNFTALKSINLSNNKVESLPAAIGNLIHLESMHLDNNQLHEIPDELAVLNFLKHFTAAENSIHSIPSGLGQSHNLETLDLSYNQLRTIPEELGNCNQLYEIHLNNNLIESIPESFGDLSDLANVYLHDNEIQGPIPPGLMTSSGDHKHVTLTGSRFIYSDIPDSDELRFSVRDQKNVPLKKQVFKGQAGDTLSIDIRTVTRLSHPSNEYYWLTYPELVTAVTKGDRFSDLESNPVLEVVLNENTVRNTYYCKVFNPDVPEFNFTYDGSGYGASCLEYLNTDTVVFQLASDEELIAEEYTDANVTSLHALPDKKVSDRTVTLVPPLKVKRGEIIWEASVDGIHWESVSATMDQDDLRANLQHVSDEELVLYPKKSAYYRCGVLESGCDPLYSEPLKVDAFGEVLFDEIINVTENSQDILLDSIEVIVPQYFYDEDFRMTITRIEDPPPAPAMVVPGAAYDISVSFADTFHLPLVVKLKNLDKTRINEQDINRFEAVYFDEQNREWKSFEHSSLSLKDSSMVIVTNHLTKMRWWWYPEEYRRGFTDVYQRNNIFVFYKDADESYINLYAAKQSAQPWHVSGTPVMIQDITEYLPKIIAKYESLGLSVPGGKVKVYIEDLGGEDGRVSVLGMLQGYISVSRIIETPVSLRQVLAHEFMHYVQDDYISAHGGNLFWMEAHATLSDRIVWNDTEVPLAESEEVLLDGRKGENYAFHFLADSWDAWDLSVVSNRFVGNVQYYYTAGTFLHYMRSFREGKKLEPATLLKETSWLGSWRTYLGGYISNHLDAILGDEYEDFIKYILSGKNEQFTLLNKKGNPFAYIQDPDNKEVFTYPVSYRFKKGDDMVQKDEMNINVPYLASKVVLLENTNPDTMVLVKYERKHDFDYDHLVYHASYDVAKEEMTFVDISDSTEYSILLDARNDENVQKKFSNYSFLVLINKEYIGASSLIDDFNASFDLTAMPVFNIESVGLLSIYDGNSPIVHRFQMSGPEGGTTNKYIQMGSPDAGWLQRVTDFQVRMGGKSTSKKILNDHTYQIRTRYTLVLDQGFIMGIVTMKDSTIYEQIIEHDIASGSLKVTEHEEGNHMLHTYIRFIEGEDGVEEQFVHGRFIDIKESFTKTFVIDHFMDWVQPSDVAADYVESHGKNILVFETANTTETRQAISKIEATYRESWYDQEGLLSGQENAVYTGTDYSDPGLQLRMIIRIAEE